jgi:MFS family permease
MLFAGALLMQYPIGWLSDRMSRGKLIFGASFLGGFSSVFGWISHDAFWPLMISAFFAGGVTTPLYSLFLAYTNDSLSPSDMPAASGGLVFTFGLGAIVGPLLSGWFMQVFGPSAFWIVLGSTFISISVYALYSISQQGDEVPVEETDSYLGVLPTTSTVAVEAASEWAIENAEHQAEMEAETEARESDEESEEDRTS